jgi:hypothetical protein
MNEHKEFMLVHAPLGDVIALCPMVFIDALGVTRGGAECSSSSRMKGVSISCRYLKGRDLFMGGAGVPKLWQSPLIYNSGLVT